MRFKEYLKEEYVASGKTCYGGKSYEIFKNPSKKEIADCANPNEGDVRLCVDLKEKCIYVWDMRLTHADASPALEREGFLPKNAYPGLVGERLLYAYGFYKNGKLEYWDEWWGNKNKVLQAAKRLGFTKDYDDSWMKTWFSITPKEKYLSGNVSDILNEEYFSLTSGNVEIYKNSGFSEIRKIADNLHKAFRFIINFDKQDIYFWNSDNATHYDAVNYSKDLKREFPNGYKWHEYYCGYGVVKNGKIIHASDSFKFTEESLAFLNSVNDEWTEDYFGEKISTQILDYHERYPKKDYISSEHSLWKNEIINIDVYDYKG